MRVLFAVLSTLAAMILAGGLALTAAWAQGAGLNINQATLTESNQATPEVSTDEVRQALADGSAIVYDSRPPLQYALGHIPGAISAPDLSLEGAAAMHMAGIQQLAPNKDSAIILYCNGPV